MIQSLSLLSFLLVCSCAHAAIILDSASAPIGQNEGGNLLMGDFNWPFHRFEVTERTSLSKVGGAFGILPGDTLTVFAAIVALADSNDVPNSLNLSTSDVLGTTLIPFTSATALYTGSIQLTLDPGWYALQFGSGAFGASNIPFPPPSMLVRHTVDLAPGQSTFVSVQEGHPTLAAGVYEFASPYRFYVEGTAVPEPSSTCFCLAGGFVLLLRLRRKRSKSANCTARIEELLPDA